MRTPKSIRVGATATVLAAALVLLGLTGASAESSHGGSGGAPSTNRATSLCSGGRTVYRASNSSITFTQAKGTNSSITGGPGITLTISRATTFTVGGSIGASADVSASAEIVTVKQAFNVTLTASKSGTSTSSGSWKVPANYKVGRLAIGAFKYKGTVTRYLENKNCALVKYGAAAQYNAPANEWSFQRSKVA